MAITDIRYCICQVGGTTMRGAIYILILGSVCATQLLGIDRLRYIFRPFYLAAIILGIIQLVFILLIALEFYWRYGNKK